MLKWLIVFVLCSLVFSSLRPLLARLGLGRMPGDFRLLIGGRPVLIPLGSTLCFSLAFWLLARLI
jgi:Protein of unknown function (DUF2905)